jgi:hypothetical protein
MTDKIYKCEICNKIYSNYNTLWNHNKKFHKVKEIIIKKLIQCEYCAKVFKNRSTKSMHKKKCDKNNPINVEKIKLENKKADIENKKADIEKLKEETKKLKEEKEIMKIKLKLQNSKNLDTKTFKSVNKILMNRSYNNTQNIQTQNINNTQNITNNINIVGFGNENIIDTLSDKEKHKIINSGYLCLEKIIEICNLGNYDQFKNLVITNLKDNYVYKYDDIKGYFVTADKTNSINELIDNRICDIDTIYNNIGETKKIDLYMKNKVKEFIDKLQDEEKTIIIENKKFDNYKELQIDKIIILLYNNQDKITKDIHLLIEK